MRVFLTCFGVEMQGAGRVVWNEGYGEGKRDGRGG